MESKISTVLRWHPTYINVQINTSITKTWAVNFHTDGRDDKMEEVNLFPTMAELKITGKLAPCQWRGFGRPFQVCCR